MERYAIIHKSLFDHLAIEINIRSSGGAISFQGELDGEISRHISDRSSQHSFNHHKEVSGSIITSSSPTSNLLHNSSESSSGNLINLGLNLSNNSLWLIRGLGSTGVRERVIDSNIQVGLSCGFGVTKGGLYAFTTTAKGAGTLDEHALSVRAVADVISTARTGGSGLRLALSNTLFVCISVQKAAHFSGGLNHTFSKLQAIGLTGSGAVPVGPVSLNKGETIRRDRS